MPHLTDASRRGARSEMRPRRRASARGRSGLLSEPPLHAFYAVSYSASVRGRAAPRHAARCSGVWPRPSCRRQCGRGSGRGQGRCGGEWPRPSCTLMCAPASSSAASVSAAASPPPWSLSRCSGVCLAAHRLSLSPSRRRVTEEGAGSQFRCSGVCPEGEIGGLSATSLRSLGDLSAIALCPEVKSAVFGDAPAASSALLARRGSTPNTQ